MKFLLLTLFGLIKIFVQSSKMWNNCCCEYIDEDCHSNWCSTNKVKGRFGLAFVAETPCCCPEPIGWQVEFCDTPSKVEQRCKEMVMWANCPPLPRCEPRPPTEIVSPCYPPKCNPCFPLSNPCSSQYSDSNGSCDCCISKSQRKTYPKDVGRPALPSKKNKRCQCRGDTNNTFRRGSLSENEEEIYMTEMTEDRGSSDNYNQKRSYRNSNHQYDNLYDVIPVKEIRQKSPFRQTGASKNSLSVRRRNCNNSYKQCCSTQTFSTATDMSFCSDPNTREKRKKRRTCAHRKSRQSAVCDLSSKLKSERERGGTDTTLNETPTKYKPNQFLKRNSYGVKSNHSNSYNQSVDPTKRNNSVDSLDLPTIYYSHNPSNSKKLNTDSQRLDDRDDDENRTHNNQSKTTYPPPSMFSDNLYPCRAHPKPEIVCANKPLPYILNGRKSSIPINAETMTSNSCISAQNTSPSSKKTEEVDNRFNTVGGAKTEKYYVMHKRLFVAHIPPFTVPSRRPVCEIKEIDKNTTKLPCKSNQNDSSKEIDAKTVKIIEKKQERCQRKCCENKSVCTEINCEENKNYLNSSSDQQQNSSKQSEDASNQISTSAVIYKQEEKISDTLIKEVKGEKDVGASRERLSSYSFPLNKSRHNFNNCKNSNNNDTKQIFGTQTVTEQGGTQTNFYHTQSVRFKDIEEGDGSEILTYFRGKTNFDSVSSTDGVITEFVGNLAKSEKVNIPPADQEFHTATSKQPINENHEGKCPNPPEVQKGTDENKKRVRPEDLRHKRKSNESPRSSKRSHKIEEVMKIEEVTEDDDSSYVEKKRRWPFDFFRNISRRLGDMFKNESDSETLTEPLIYIDGVPYSYPHKYTD